MTWTAARSNGCTGSRAGRAPGTARSRARRSLTRADDPTRVGIDDERDVHLPGPRGDLGEAGHPQPVRRRCEEPAVNQVRRPLVPWRVASSMTTALVLDALEHALFTRAAGIADVTGLISHSDAGSQYTSVALTERLIEAGADPSAGTVGAALDNA